MRTFFPLAHPYIDTIDQSHCSLCILRRPLWKPCCMPKNPQLFFCFILREVKSPTNGNAELEGCCYGNQLFVTTCKVSSSLQTLPQQHFPYHVPYCPPGNNNRCFRATQHQSTVKLIQRNIFRIDNRSNQKLALGDMMDIDKFSKRRAQPCSCLMFLIFQLMPLIRTICILASRRGNQCFVQLFI